YLHFKYERGGFTDFGDDHCCLWGHDANSFADRNAAGAHLPDVEPLERDRRKFVNWDCNVKRASAEWWRRGRFVEQQRWCGNGPRQRFRSRTRFRPYLHFTYERGGFTDFGDDHCCLWGHDANSFAHRNAAGAHLPDVEPLERDGRKFVN